MHERRSVFPKNYSLLIPGFFFSLLLTSPLGSSGELRDTSARQYPEAVQQVPIHARDVVESFILWMNLVVPAAFHQILCYDEMPPEPLANVFVRADPRLLQLAGDPFAELKIVRRANRI